MSVSSTILCLFAIFAYASAFAINGTIQFTNFYDDSACNFNNNTLMLNLSRCEVGSDDIPSYSVSVDSVSPNNATVTFYGTGSDNYCYSDKPTNNYILQNKCTRVNNGNGNFYYVIAGNITLPNGDNYTTAAASSTTGSVSTTSSTPVSTTGGQATTADGSATTSATPVTSGSEATTASSSDPSGSTNSGSPTTVSTTNSAATTVSGGVVTSGASYVVASVSSILLISLFVAAL
eukprot:TRINITY_DN602_c0_g1_i2.p1 TRINITY_DN602_c0_g1~~TRINITY_DN602_c0_g1_i2.p1  ORF type:complete len:234 (+),score=61.61 TRINITY_DN602_c0_g1_i2:159-860(+)